jgi:hypothetical protein
MIFDNFRILRVPGRVEAVTLGMNIDQRIVILAGSIFSAIVGCSMLKSSLISKV